MLNRYTKPLATLATFLLVLGLSSSAFAKGPHKHNRARGAKVTKTTTTTTKRAQPAKKRVTKTTTTTTTRTTTNRGRKVVHHRPSRDRVVVVHHTRPRHSDRYDRYDRHYRGWDIVDVDEEISYEWRRGERYKLITTTTFYRNGQYDVEVDRVHSPPPRRRRGRTVTVTYSR